MSTIRAIGAAQMKKEIDDFKVGDTVKVHFQMELEEKEKEKNEKGKRVQIYEGLVIAFKNAGIGRTFTVRKISYGVGVERVFPLHSPKVVKVEVTRAGKVRRAKLYYIRDKIGKAAKIKQLILPGKNAAATKAAPSAVAENAAE